MESSTCGMTIIDITACVSPGYGVQMFRATGPTMLRWMASQPLSVSSRCALR